MLTTFLVGMCLESFGLKQFEFSFIFCGPSRCLSEVPHKIVPMKGYFVYLAQVLLLQNKKPREGIQIGLS